MAHASSMALAARRLPALGHGNRRIAEAIGRQAATMAYAHTGTFSSQPAEDLAHIVLDGEPGGLSHAYFCSSGSEGTEAALKLARQYFVEIGQPQRTHFIARRQSYHGNTLGALGAGGNMMRRALLRADPGAGVQPGLALLRLSFQT